MELFCGVVERCCSWSNEHELKRRREEVVARILLVKESNPQYGECLVWGRCPEQVSDDKFVDPVLWMK